MHLQVASDLLGGKKNRMVVPFRALAIGCKQSSDWQIVRHPVDSEARKYTIVAQKSINTPDIKKLRVQR